MYVDNLRYDLKLSWNIGSEKYNEYLNYQTEELELLNIDLINIKI